MTARRTRPRPGPDAERAFALGLAATTVGALALIGLLLWGGVLTPAGAAVASIIGVPVLVVVTSCLLGVWLGYAADSYARVRAAASRR